MSTIDLAPIVLFVYNRPEHTKRTVEGILSNPEAKDTILYIFADGPKPNISQEGMLNLQKTREYIHTIKGFKDVVIDESDQNRGLAPATIRGCSYVINKHGRMIMIEDDDVPTPFFLAYENECLEKFKDDERVWCIGGYVDANAMPPRDGDDVFFVNRPTSWGFGTWKRCWDKVIWNIEDLRGIFKHKSIIRGFDNWGGRDHYHTMDNLLNGRNSSWSIRFHFAAYINNTYTIYPNKSLITNIGCDSTGTHCGTFNTKPILFERKPIIPEVVKFDRIRNKEFIKSFYPLSISWRAQLFSLYHPWAKRYLPLIYKMQSKFGKKNRS